MNERDEQLVLAGWTEREINLLNAYEAKIADFARETRRTSALNEMVKFLIEELEKCDCYE